MSLLRILFVLICALPVIIGGASMPAHANEADTCQCEKDNGDTIATPLEAEPDETAPMKPDTEDAADEPMADTALSDVPAGLLTVQNFCEFPVWIEQQGLNNVGIASVIGPIAPGGEYKYDIPEDQDVPSVRLWPKSGCSEQGDNCAIGQSSGPCPAGGCSPVVDSKLELSWLEQTWFNLSMVDGYTIPIGVTAIDSNGERCIDAHPTGLSVGAAECPTDEDISLGGQFPDYASVDLRAYNPDTKEPIGCYSPCNKLRSPEASGGFNMTEDSEQTDMYCCAGVAIDRDICIAGPLKDTKFSNMIHDAYPGQQVYAWAYDDEAGMATCAGKSEVLFTICK